MKKIALALVMIVPVMALMFCLTGCSGSDDDTTSQLWDALQVNSDNYACYGKRSYVTYSSEWSSSRGIGRIALPCGKLSDAQKGEYDIDYLFAISFTKNQPLQKGDDLADYATIFEDASLAVDNTVYESGSAVVIDKKDDDYITIKFNSFTCGKGSNARTLNGTVQLDLDED